MSFLPFKMIVQSDMELYRANSFWDKEPETIEWIKSFKDDAIFFDIGANIGIYSLYCASIHPNSKVLAFEPSKYNFFRLLDNIRLNQFKNIHPSMYIICDKTGNMDFVETSEEIGSSGGQAKDSWEIGEVGCWSLDDFIIHGFYSPNPDHIKIDIDGQELKVVHGMKETLKSQKLKSVLIEIDKETGMEIVKILIDFGFTMQNRFNIMLPHSRLRRKKEGINVENIIFTRKIKD